jgi:hypothetical protein
MVPAATIVASNLSLVRRYRGSCILDRNVLRTHVTRVIMLCELLLQEITFSKLFIRGFHASRWLAFDSRSNHHYSVLAGQNDPTDDVSGPHLLPHRRILRLACMRFLPAQYWRVTSL